MSITSPTFVPGAVLDAEDLDAAYLVLTNEINRLAALPHNSQNLAKNFVINGDLSVWQYATSQTTSGYGSDDRFTNLNTGSTKVHSQQAFTVGQTDVTNNPKYYSRTVVTSVANAANFCLKEHRIEDVTKLSGETVTLQFWAKVGSAKNIAVEVEQNFGTGGSPSTAVDEINVSTLAITTSWVLQTVTFAMPSVSGKTLGTDGNDYTAIKIWFDAGSDHDLNTNSLGQQSGTFELANIQLEISATATDFEYVTPADQLARCKRYFEKLVGNTVDQTPIGLAYGESTTVIRGTINYSEKRAIPTITASASAADFEILTPGSGPTASTFTSSLDTGTKSSLLAVTRDSGTHTIADVFIIRIAQLVTAYVDISAEL